MQYHYILPIILVGCSSSFKDEASKPTNMNAAMMQALPSSTYINSLPEINACPEDMVEVEGDFCPEVEQTCIKIDESIHNVNGYAKCDEFKSPTVCLSKNKIHMHFCINKYEAQNKKGELPERMVSWDEAKVKCESKGERLCRDVEWTLACEGPDMFPYPTGYVRDSNACNIDHLQVRGVDGSKPLTEDELNRIDQRVPSGSMQCVSPYGVEDMTGNVDEFVNNSSGKPYVSAMKGGHWVRGARNRCRPATLAHGPTFSNYESSYRCCKNTN
jgi:sulfatase modifying factor 1